MKNIVINRVSILGILLCLVLPTRPATAGAYTYGTGAQRTVNAGILLLDESKPSVNPALGGDNPDPYVFHILNQRTDIKPNGWTILNPLAPKAVTTAVQARWNARTGGTPTNPAYPLGVTVTPSMAAYWEVPLTTTTSTDLAQFDILFINLIRQVALTAADTEKLRRFVDGGGTLWIENSGPVGNTATTGGAGGDILATGPLFFELHFVTPTATGTGTAVFSAVSRNPIITTPYQLSELELNSLGDKHIGDYYSTGTTNTGAGPGPGFTTVVGNYGHSGLPVIAVQQFGAGQVIVTCTGSANTINEYVGGTTSDINIGFGTNSGPYCGTNYALAPTQDLKLLTDIISAADTHSAERQNSHQTGSAVNPLSSPVRTWNDTASAFTGTPLPATLPGAVISGHLAFVVGGKGSSSKDGVLRAYDIYPSEDLDGDGNPDDGDNDNGAPYDIVWHADGPFDSAPTVGTLPDGKTLAVFVEDSNGVVSGFNAISGLPLTIPKPKLTGTPTTFPAIALAPAPTYYGGRIYAGEPDGSLYVYDFNAGASASSGVDYVPNSANASASTGETVTASPTVGLVPADDNGTVNGNDIVVMVPTTKYVYSVYIGARGELLGGTGPTYLTKLTRLTSGSGTGALIDPGAVPAFRTYTLNGGLPFAAGLTISSTNGSEFTGTMTGTPSVYADYDSNFGSTSTPTAAQSLTRTIVGLTSQNNYPAYSASVSAPALDGKGNTYYVSGNRLFSFHDASAQGDVRLNWCFQLPRTGETITDADGTNYTQLAGDTFVGAPVVDDQGYVYAMATNGTSTAVLCFSTAATVSADLFASGTEVPVNSVQVTQPDPTNASVDLFLGPGPPPINGTQVTIGGTGHMDFRSFSTAPTNMNGTNTIYPNLAEPYPVAVTYNLGDINNTDPTVPVTQQSSTVPLHTNLVWYTVLGVHANASGFTKVGSRLLFVDTAGQLDSVITDPQAESVTLTLKSAPAASMLTRLGNANVGNIASVPSASNGAMIVSGSGGVAAYTNQVTLVVDSNRILEMNSSGDAQWAVDSTYEQALVGGTSSVYTATNGSGGNGQVGTTSVDFNRPTALTELTQNDYLVADTGNNRCVRFDRAGKVVWELTKFTDPNGLLQSGEPDTLNQPTSVQIYTAKDSSGDTIVRYLISDTGNFRIVEVDDIYGVNGVNQIHVLQWVSHTQDAQNRQYRYQSAAYYLSPAGNAYVVALVTNTRVASPAAPTAPNAGTPGASNTDTGGGSIALLYYDSTNAAATKATNGYIAYTLSDFYADLKMDGTFDLPKAVVAANPASGTPAVPTGATLLHLRNPRYLKIYTPQGGTGTARNYLIADDNGVYDLVQATDAKGKNAFLAQWGFTPADYKAVTTPIDNNGYIAQAAYSRALIPFLPASIQREGTDTVGGYQVGRYLITNSYSQGEASNNTGTTTPGFGGEVLELGIVDATTFMTREVHDNGAGVYTGHTTSRPSSSNTSPLSQPTFAYRLQ